MNAIEMKGLTKFYGKSRGIVDLDLTVPEGEFFGFIGPNGAGKSTTIRTLLGLIRSSGGSARIFGKDIAAEKSSILAEVGYMPSEAVFYPGMRVREVIRLSAGLRKKGLCAGGGAAMQPAGVGRIQKGGRAVLRKPEKGVHRMRLQHHPGCASWMSLPAVWIR